MRRGVTPDRLSTRTKIARGFLSLYNLVMAWPGRRTRGGQFSPRGFRSIARTRGISRFWNYLFVEVFVFNFSLTLAVPPCPSVSESRGSDSGRGRAFHAERLTDRWWGGYGSGGCWVVVGEYRARRSIDDRGCISACLYSSRDRNTFLSYRYSLR